MEKSKKKNLLKGVVLITILVLPSLFYLVLTTGKHNFIYLPNIVYHQGEYTIDKTSKEYPENEDVQIKFATLFGWDLETNKAVEFDALPKEVYAVQFYESDTLLDKDAALYRLIDHQIAKRFVPFKDLTMLTIWSSKNADTNYKSLKSKLNSDFKSWKHIKVDPKTFTILKNQFFIKPVQALKPADKQLLFVMDKERKLRTGWDKQDNIFFAYNAGKEYVNKLLLEDMKLLLAEYLKSLKSRDAENK